MSAKPFPIEPGAMPLLREVAKAQSERRADDDSLTRLFLKASFGLPLGIARGGDTVDTTAAGSTDAEGFGGQDIETIPGNCSAIFRFASSIPGPAHRESLAGLWIE